MSELAAGSSGWSYLSWRPDFYSAGLAPEDFFSFYAERLPSVELNTTGYRLPSEEQFARWAAAVPDGFRFAVKAPPRALRSFSTFEERVRMLGDRLGPIRVVVESARDDGLLALLLGSTDLALALDLRDESWDGADVAPAVRVNDWEGESTLPLPPLPGAALRRRGAPGARRPDCLQRASRCSPTSATRTRRALPRMQIGCFSTFVRNCGYTSLVI